MPVADPITSMRAPDARSEKGFLEDVSQRTRDFAAPEDKEKPSAEAVAAAAIEPLQKAAEALGRRVDVEYREDIEMVVMVVYEDPPPGSDEGEKFVRQVPREEAVRLAQRLQQGIATLLDEVV